MRALEVCRKSLRARRVRALEVYITVAGHGATITLPARVFGTDLTCRRAIGPTMTLQAQAFGGRTLHYKHRLLGAERWP